MTTKRRTTTGFLALMAMGASMMLSVPAHADQGVSRDLTFGTNGRVSLGPRIDVGYPMPLTVQNDGGILVGASVNGVRGLRRLHANGTTDTSFGVNGDLSVNARAWDLPTVATDPIYVLTAPGFTTFDLWRYLADGTLDTSFGTDGKVTVSLTGSGIWTNPTLLRVGGTIAFSASFTNGPGSTSGSEIHRWTANGTPDASFGVDGVAIIPSVAGNVVGADGSGRMLLQFPGWAGYARLTAAGVLDTTFADNGVLTIAFPDLHVATFVAADGSLFTAGDAEQKTRLAIRHYTAAGAVDAAFGTGGATLLDFASVRSGVPTTEFLTTYSLVRADATHLLVGVQPLGGAGLVRIGTNGMLDPSFGVAGKAIASTDIELARAVALPNGSVLIASAGTNMFLQRSTVGGPWPPVSAAPASVTATPVHVGAQVHLQVNWSAVPNPDPEVVNFRYDVNVTRHADGAFVQFRDEPGTVADVGPLVAGTYDISVAARNAYALGTPRVITVTVPKWTPTLDVSRPIRLVDTRTTGSTVDGRYQRGGRLTNGTFQVAGRGGYPAGTHVVSLQVMAVNPTTNGSLVIYPCGAVPAASTMSFVAGRTTTQATVATLDATGRVCVRSTAATHLVVAGTGTVQTQYFTGLRPTRLIDTRPLGTTIDGVGAHTGALRPTPDGGWSFPVAGRGGLPASSRLVWANIAASAPSRPGSLYAWPCGTLRPRLPLFSFPAGPTTTVGTWLRLDAGGEVCIATTATTNVIVDTTGGMTTATPAQVTMYRPKVLVDTRINGSTDDRLFQRQGSLAPSTVQRYRLAGRAGIDAHPYALHLSVTALNPSAAGSLSVYACGTTSPPVPTVSFTAGVGTTASTTVRLGFGDEVCVVSTARTHLQLAADVRFGALG